jgi:cytosine/adenosine deaminase-related metal-dependent hydrolase
MRMQINARNRAVTVEGGRIVAPGGRCDLVLDCRDADLRPGLINAHDHLHRNHYGRLGCPTYANAYRWADDIQVRYRREIARRRRLPRREALLAGAWKNLCAGVTTVVHHDPWEPDFERGFPINVARVACADSLGKSEHVEAADEGPLCVHVAEGVDDESASEIAEFDRRGLLDRRLIAVHAVGLDAAGIQRFRQAGAALVWCPTSNRFLFGRTAPADLLRDGVDVLIGSDSLLTGDGDLLDELRAARASGLVADARLTDAVGSVAARRLGLAEPALEPGHAADLILIRQPVLQARADDVVLTMVAGVPRISSEALARQLGAVAERGTRMRVGQVMRWANSNDSTDWRFCE